MLDNVKNLVSEFDRNDWKRDEIIPKNGTGSSIFSPDWKKSSIVKWKPQPFGSIVPTGEEDARGKKEVWEWEFNKRSNLCGKIHQIV